MPNKYQTLQNKKDINLGQFLNPTPNSKKNEVFGKSKEAISAAKEKENKHGRHAGSYLDDTGDIYDHTKSFFDKSGVNHDEITETHYKTIRPNIADLMDELNPEIYKA